MTADRWWDYTGPLCDDPAELGLPYDEPELDLPDAADLAGLDYDLAAKERRP